MFTPYAFLASFFSSDKTGYDSLFSSANVVWAVIESEPESDQHVPLGQITRLTCADANDFQLWVSLERDIVRLGISERACLGGTDGSAGFGKL